MPVPPRTQREFREVHELPGWRIELRSTIGQVRRRLEDAWVVLPRARFRAAETIAFGVFDGLGGMPRGQEAAWAAADGLADILPRCHSPEHALGELNRLVRGTGGSTTALVAIIRPGSGDGDFLSVGDSGGYVLGLDHRPRLLAPKDSDGPNVVSDYLGNPDLKGHQVHVELGVRQALLLCSDGVDEVVGPDALVDALKSASRGTSGALDALLAEVDRLGAPDNATALLALRMG